MQYGGPVYSRSGVAQVGFASQKQFIGIYILGAEVMNTHKHLLTIPGVSLCKGCIRYSKPGKIDFRVGEKMLKATAESEGELC